MRTYELHSTFKDIKRADSRSAVAAAAYRSGTRLLDERTGDVSDYTRKGGVEHSQLYAPALAPEWVTNRQTLWNAAQTKENRKNSMLARELEVGFPAEFNEQQRREAGGLIAKHLVEKFGAAVDIAYHLPGKDGDSRNYHAHIMFTGRSIDPTQPDGWAKNKYRDLNKDLVEVDGEKTLRSSVTAKEWKAFIAETFNQISTRDGLNVHTEHRSFKERGLEKIPTVKLGPVAAAMEREGKPSERGDINRAVVAISAEIIRLTAKLNDERDDLECMVEPDKVIDRYKKVWAVEREIITVKSGELKAKTDRQIDRQELKINSLAKAEPRKGLFTTKTTHAKNLKQWRNTAQQLNNRRWQLKERADKLKKGGIETREGKYEGYDYQTDGDKLAHKRVERKEPRLAGMYQKAKQAQWEKDREKLQQKRQNTRQQPQQNQNPRGDGR